MKSKKIRILETTNSGLKVGKEYPVTEWFEGRPIVKGGHGRTGLFSTKWEPVTEFKHGDPVWAWDNDKEDMKKGIYLCENPNDEGCTHMVMWSHVTNTAFGYKNVKHIKPTITIKELAKRADINLNEYELIE